MERRKFDPKASERAYMQFMDLMNTGRVEEAYGIFRETPTLMSSLRFIDIATMYVDLKSNLGDKAATYFFVGFLNQIKTTLKDIELTSLLQEGGDSFRLEDLLEGLDEEHRKMLDELGDQDENSPEK
jgi:hypothetical protein